MKSKEEFTMKETKRINDMFVSEDTTETAEIKALFDRFKYNLKQCLRDSDDVLKDVFFDDPDNTPWSRDYSGKSYGPHMFWKRGFIMVNYEIHVKHKTAVYGPNDSAWLYGGNWVITARVYPDPDNLPTGEVINWETVSEWNRLRE
jgi:hypothetical protein